LVPVFIPVFVGLAGAFCAPAFGRDCNASEKAAADAQLWLNQRDYVIAYSDTLLVPLWTAHRLDAAGLGKTSRVDCFRRDPRIPAPAASLPSDYDEAIYDQGHLTPNGDMSRALIAVINSFILSNMAPQHCQFNRGVWQIAESLVRIWSEELGPPQIITGSVFANDPAPARMVSRNHKARVAIPTHFYKVIARRLSDGSVATLAILMPNDETDLDGSDALRYIEDHIVPLAAIEAAIGFALLPKLATPAPQQATALWPHAKTAARSLAGDCAP
jgi:DNA/RNA endonuclease G (NUC1)